MVFHSPWVHNFASNDPAKLCLFVWNHAVSHRVRFPQTPNLDFFFYFCHTRWWHSRSHDSGVWSHSPLELHVMRYVESPLARICPSRHVYCTVSWYCTLSSAAAVSSDVACVTVGMLSVHSFTEIVCCVFKVSRPRYTLINMLMQKQRWLRLVDPSTLW